MFISAGTLVQNDLSPQHVGENQDETLMKRKYKNCKAKSSLHT